jgi:hypothetical protein
MINSTSPPPLDPSFLRNQASASPAYPVPISRLFDVNAGNIGALALGNGDGIGLAEYSNANFFSDDTIFPETFPYPGVSNLEPTGPELDPTTGKKKTYLKFKPGFGEQNYRLAQGSSLRMITGTNVPTDIGLDNNVLKDYGTKLFPRAIGYSAGLIDYFFRGELATHAVDIGCFWPQFPRPPEFQIALSNISPPGEETGQGEMSFAVHYKVNGESHWFSLPGVTVSLDRETIWITFAGSTLDQVPANATDTYFLPVYKGPLGNESQGGVVVSRGEFAGLC